METQPKNHDDNRASNGQLLKLLLEVKALAQSEKKAKEMKASSALESENHQDARNTWFKATSSFTTT